MKTNTKPKTTLPFELGDERSFGGLTLVPLFPRDEPKLEYVGLDEAVARGLVVKEVDAEAIVGELLVENPLDELVLLYEGEELVGAKQNRIIQELDARRRRTRRRACRCAASRRAAGRSARPKFQPAPHAAYPSLRKESRTSQQAVWNEVASKAQRARGAVADGRAGGDLRQARAPRSTSTRRRCRACTARPARWSGSAARPSSSTTSAAPTCSRACTRSSCAATRSRRSRRRSSGRSSRVEARRFLADLETASLRARRRLGRRLADGARGPRRRLDPPRPRGAGRGRGLPGRVGSRGEPNEPRPDDA